MEIRSRGDSVPILYIIRAYQIILRNDRIIPGNALAYDRSLVEKSLNFKLCIQSNIKSSERAPRIKPLFSP
jgi:hypothetical protein